MKPTAAKLPGICPACRRSIRVGSPIVKDPTRDRWVHAGCSTPGGTTSAASSTSVTWATLMFTSLPSDLQPKAYKALARVLHPDAGGDTVTMQVLATAWDQHKKGGCRLRERAAPQERTGA